MAKKHVDTFPSDAGSKSSRDFELLTVAGTRDCTANARGYGATQSFSGFVKRNGKTYFLYFDDAEPLDDEDDVINSCCWHKTKGEGGSLFGQGLKCIAANLVEDVTNTELIVAAKCKNGEFCAAQGTYSEPKRWNVIVTDEWQEFIRSCCGPKTYKEMKVFYLMAANPRRRGRGGTGLSTCFTMPGANILPFSAPTYFEKFDARFTQDVLVGTIDDAKVGGTSSKNRPIPSLDDYCARFMADDGLYVLDCEPFRIDILRNTQIEVTKAKIELRIFLGLEALIKGKSKQWFANHRSTPSGKVGAGPAQGSKPNQTGFLFLPYIARADNGDSEIREAYQRYQTNAVYFGDSDEMLRELGLRYIANQKVALTEIEHELDPEYIAKAELMGKPLNDLRARPFVVATLVIDEVADKITFNDNGSETRIKCEPSWLETQLEPSADFTFKRYKTLREIMKEAGKAAEHSVPTDLRERLVNLFPVSEDGFVPIGGVKTTTTERSTPFLEVYDLESDDLTFNKKFQDGSNRFLAFRDIQTTKFQSATELQPASITRGVVLDNLNGNIRLLSRSQRDKIQANLKELTGSLGETPQVVIVSVDELCREENGKKVPITKEEYEHKVSFFPSRQVRIKKGTKTQTIGVVDDVPKWSTGVMRTVGGSGGHGGKGRPYTDRDACILAEWDEDRRFLKLNKVNPEIMSTFGPPFVVGDKICDLCEVLYDKMNIIAKGAWDGIALCEVTSPVEMTSSSSEPKYLDNKSDIVIQHLLDSWWAESTDAHEIKDKIVNLRQKLGGSEA